MSVDNVWDNSDGDNDGNVAANWSQNRVPTAGDIAVFDHNTTDDNCTFSGAISCDGMRFDNAYAGIVDAATFNITLGTGGLDCTGGGSATLDLGSGTWECSGDFDCQDLLSLDDGTSKIKMTGTGKTLTRGTPNLYDVEITGTITYSASSTSDKSIVGALTVSGQFTVNQYVRFAGTCVNSGTITIAAGKRAGIFNGTTLTNTGTITGAGTLLMYKAVDSWTLTNTTGTIDVALLECWRSGTVSAGTYASATVRFRQENPGDYTITFGSGNFLFTGAVSYEAEEATASYTVDMDTNDPDVEYRGDVTFIEVSTLNYLKGTALITLGGSNDQSINTLGKHVEDIRNDKTAGQVTLDGHLWTDSFDGVDSGTGSFDPNGKTITTDGDCDWAAAFLFAGDADAMNGSAWDIGGNFTADGQDLYATDTWTLSVTGTAVASGTGYVEHCDASGGTEIDASAGPWTHDDPDTNVNWNFGAAAGAIMNQFQEANLGADLYNGTLVA